MSVKSVRRLLALALVFLLLSPGTPWGFSIKEEREMGEELLYQVRKAFRLVDDPDISQYINRLGDEILDVAGPQYFQYHFFVIRDKSFNAFAAPSGLIFLHTGLIDAMKSENELVSVMAHEVGHVVSRHIASRMEKSKKVNAATMALALAGLFVGDPSLTAGILTGSMAAGQSAGLAFSRIDEEQADRLSFTWMKAMGRNPEAMARMLKLMRRISRYRSAQVPRYLLTHPDPEARLDYVRSLIEVERQQHPGGIRWKPEDQFSFLRVKYRILAQVKDDRELRPYFAGKLSTGKAGDLETLMARYGLALLDAQERNTARALRALEEVRAALPERSILKVDAGILYMDQGDTARALELFEQAAAEDPRDLYAAFQLARALSSVGQKARAGDLLRRVTRDLPDYSKGWYELGRLEADEGRAGDSYYALGRYNLLEGKIGMARRFLNLAIDDPGTGQENRGRAESLLERIETMEHLAQNG